MGEDITEVRVVASDGLHCAPAIEERYREPEHSMIVSAQGENDREYRLFKASGTLLSLSEQSARIVAPIMIDGAATFDAIRPELAKILGYEIKEHQNPLRLSLGGAQNTTMQRRTTTLRLEIPNFPVYEAICFVMDLPEGHDVLLGTPWHRRVNPDIDWDTESIRPRLTRAERRGGVRRGNPKRMPYLKYQHHRLMQMLAEVEPRVGSSTEIVAIHRTAQLKKLLRLENDEFAFFVQQQHNESEKARRQTAAASWEALKGNPAYDLCLKYKDTVFRTELPREPPRKGILKAEMKHRMEVDGSEPIHVKQFRVSPEQREAIENWVQEMLEAGLIRPSNSPFCAPTFAVRKAVGWRIVHDYRRINQRTRIPQPYALRKEDIFDQMAGSHWFSTCDLLHGYYQQYMHPDDVQFTGFSTPIGQFEYLVMPQGLSGAPGSFNRLVQWIFQDMRDIVRVYFDDAFIFTKSTSIEDHLEALERFFDRCREQQLYLKLAKCTFCAAEIPALGDFVGRDGVRLDPDKIKVITEWPTPQTKRQMKQFLGTVAYNARFIEGFGKLVAPLHAATKGKSKNERIRLDENQLDCFSELKRAVTTAPCLALPDFTRPFIVRMDASAFAIGGALLQLDDAGQERVVAFSGRKLTSAELNYDTRERELLAIIYALRQWRVYLLDQPFTVETDHHSLATLLSQNTCSRRLARWLSELCEFRPNFKWISGDTNTVADGLSRRPDFEPSEGASAVDLPTLLQQLLQQQHAFYGMQPMDVRARCREGYASDGYFGPMLAYFKEGRAGDGDSPSKYNNYRWDPESGLIWFKGNRSEEHSVDRLCIPQDADLCDYLIFLDHDDATRGHAGEFKTLAHLQRKYYWRQMRRSVGEYISTCERCQRNKTRQSRPPGELHPHSVPDARWTEISMDFITQLPETNSGKNMIWTMVDRLTKRVHFVAIKDTCTAEELLELFRREYQRLHGLPESIVSDRDHLFTSKIWTTYMDLIETELKMSTAFRSTVDGQSEILNRFVEDYIRNYIDPFHVSWDQHLDLAEFAYNSRFHSSIGMSPFMADLGFEPRSPADVQFEQLCTNNRFKEAKEFLLEQQVRLQLAQDCMAEAQERMKHYHDRNRPIQRFEIGDQVLLSTKNLSLPHSGVDRSGSRKFAPKRIGPFEVLEKVKCDSYRLRLPSSLRLHDVFHTSLLFPYRASDHPNRVNPPLEVILPDGDVGYIVEAIVGLKKQGSREMAKVRWLGYTPEDDTWEPVDELQNIRELIADYRQSRRRRSSRNTPVEPATAASSRGRPMRRARLAQNE